MISRLALALLATVAAAPLSLAADISLPSRIDAVTVFPDAAAVTRLGEAKLPAGQHVVLLRGLPATLDPASIRVEGRADGPLAIGSADIRRAPAETAPSEDNQKRLRDLRGELSKVRGRIEAIEAQKKAVIDFARIAAEAAAKDGKGFDIAQARAAWAAVGEGTAQANEALQSESTRAADLEAEIRALEAVTGRPRPNAQPLVDLAIVVEAGRDLAAGFKVTYRVGNARWSPVYDAALDTVANGPVAKLSLVRRASVTQRTGEDWSDVELTLSTARVAGGATAPEVQTQALALRDPVVVFDADQARRQRSLAAGARQDAPMSMAAPAPMNEVAKAVEQEASASATAFSAAFIAPGRVSVSRDGSARVLRLSTHELDAPLLAKVAPALETRAYLSTNLTWGDDVPLLPGEVSLTRDGVFVGKARIGAVAAGDQFELGFGADDRIKVERVPVRRRDNDPSGWNSTRNQISEHRTAVTNLHRRPMRISVIDRIPVSENSAITVEALPTNTAPTEKIVQDRRGVMGWTHDYAPSEKREIRLGWRLRWPADRELVGQ
ncbi:MAG: mucoidy inhibitor MuiA family protein [Hyphomicrobiales bacterium]|nr:mucoidy inhibitor MuiA family protein [Hyphomicrobiales bacterium]